MDRITQLQDGIDRLLTIMQHTIAYLTDRTDFLPLHSDVPVSVRHARADEHDEFQANQRELAADLVEQAKQIETLIDSLPSEPEEAETDGQKEKVRRMQREMAEVNEEYVRVLEEARQLREEIAKTLESVLVAVEDRLPESVQGADGVPEAGAASATE